MGEKCGCVIIEYVDETKPRIEWKSEIEYCPLHEAAGELLRAAEEALPYVEDHKKHRFLSDMIKEAKGEKAGG